RPAALPGALPAGERAEHARRAAASPRAPLRPGSGAGRVPPGEAQQRVVGLSRHPAGARQLRPAARVPLLGAEGDAHRFDRRPAFREKARRRYADRGAGAPDRLCATSGRATMKRAFFLVLLLSACASQKAAIEQARDHYTAGRGDEALKVLEQTMREHPDDPYSRREYYRMRDTLVGQWLAQAEFLRQAGRPDDAERLYNLVQAHDRG